MVAHQIHPQIRKYVALYEKYIEILWNYVLFPPLASLLSRAVICCKWKTTANEKGFAGLTASHFLLFLNSYTLLS